jgi:hypothetical protein
MRLQSNQQPSHAPAGVFFKPQRASMALRKRRANQLQMTNIAWHEIVQNLAQNYQDINPQEAKPGQK